MLPLLVAPLVVLAFAPPAAKPFDIVWSGLWPCCAGQSGLNLSAFPVLQERRLALFDGSFGLFNDTDPRVGNLPQTVDLARHAAKVAHDAATDGGHGHNRTIVPAGKDMYCCIDWEGYTPVIFDHTTPAHPHGAPGSGGCSNESAPNGAPRYSMPGSTCATCNMAMKASIALVLKKQPGLNASAAAALAAAEFNAAARLVWTTTLKVAQKTRPDCYWGFYGKPETEDIEPPFVHTDHVAVGEAFQWMFDASTALYPSTYMHGNASSAPLPLGKDFNNQYVQAIVREAERVNANRKTATGGPAPKIKVLPWVWYRYIYKQTLLEPADMHTALAGPGIAGADGVLFYEDGLSWGPSPAQRSHNKAVQAFVDSVVGPVATKLYAGRESPPRAGV
jgi:hypothetical protein